MGEVGSKYIVYSMIGMSIMSTHTHIYSISIKYMRVFVCVCVHLCHFDVYLFVWVCWGI